MALKDIIMEIPEAALEAVKAGSAQQAEDVRRRAAKAVLAAGSIPFDQDLMDLAIRAEHYATAAAFYLLKVPLIVHKPGTRLPLHHYQQHTLDQIRETFGELPVPDGAGKTTDRSPDCKSHSAPYAQQVGRMHRMKKVPISELTGPALDWAVAKAVGQEIVSRPVFGLMTPETRGWRPSTDWSQGGPLIDRFKISIVGEDRKHTLFLAIAFSDGDTIDANCHQARGPTHLVAAMRAIVAKHAQADTVAVPLALVRGKDGG